VHRSVESHIATRPYLTIGELCGHVVSSNAYFNTGFTLRHAMLVMDTTDGFKTLASSHNNDGSVRYNSLASGASNKPHWHLVTVILTRWALFRILIGILAYKRK
jgi:hypothetical protein